MSPVSIVGVPANVIADCACRTELVQRRKLTAYDLVGAALLGANEGVAVGAYVGAVGVIVGIYVGYDVGFDGAKVGVADGAKVGDIEGGAAV